MNQSNIILAYGNLVTPLVTITASQAQTLSPAKYALVDFRGPKWLSSNLTSVSVVIDLLTAQTVTCEGLLDHNITSAGTVELRASSDNFASSDVQIIPPGPLTSVKPSLRLCDAATYRYWKWLFVDAANPAGYIQVGRFWLSTFLQPTDNYAMQWIDAPQDTSKKFTTENSVPHFNAKPIRWINKLKFEKVNQDDRDAVLVFAYNVGNTAPFICALDVDNYPAKTHWMRFVSMLPEPSEADWHVYDYTFDLEEGV